jgi:hypothetical protein
VASFGLVELVIIALVLVAVVAVPVVIVVLVVRNGKPKAVQVTPGWYPDPHGTGSMRWFDGREWTAHVQ